MGWRWELTHRALKDLERLDRLVRNRIIAALDRLVDELAAGAQLSNVKRLVGTDEAEWRLRVGDYRVRFQLVFHDPVDAEEPGAFEAGVTLVVKVAHRSDIYRS
jgi:mRNA-degrading endonuclease RelE of RelBE toxin-antitoxin system